MGGSSIACSGGGEGSFVGESHPVPRKPTPQRNVILRSPEEALEQPGSSWVRANPASSGHRRGVQSQHRLHQMQVHLSRAGSR